MAGLYKIVARPQGQHTKRDSGVCELIDHTVNSTIPAAGHNKIVLFLLSAGQFRHPSLRIGKKQRYMIPSFLGRSPDPLNLVMGLPTRRFGVHHKADLFHGLLIHV